MKQHRAPANLLQELKAGEVHMCSVQKPRNTRNGEQADQRKHMTLTAATVMKFLQPQTAANQITHVFIFVSFSSSISFNISFFLFTNSISF